MIEKIRDSLSLIGIYYKLLRAIVRRTWYWLPKFMSFNSEIDYDIDKLNIAFLNRAITKAEKSKNQYYNTNALTQMKIARDLLVRVNSEYYWEEMYKYASIDFVIGPNGLLTSTTVFDNLGEYFDLHKATYKKVLSSNEYKRLSKSFDSSDDAIDNKRRLIATLMKGQLIQKSRQIAYRIVAEHSNFWW